MSNKVWFVTGASKGMGLALVKQLLNSGHKVAATSRNVDELVKQAGGLNNNLLPLQVNIGSDREVKDALLRTIITFGQLDVVVNNAGYAIYGSMEELSDQEFRDSVEINLFAMANVIRNAMPYLRQQRSGHIFNFSSIAGYRGYGSAGAYDAVKFAVVGLSEALAEEAKPFGVNVTVVAPGFFRTSFLDKGSMKMAAHRIEGYNTAGIENWMKEMDGKQSGDPQKLAKLLVDITAEINPPVHLFAGPDAYQIRKEKATTDLNNLEVWKHLTLSTDFDNQ
ncbi:short-chain dehydrogenase/reductase [Niastella yeongjuensis]|uniref:Short-chain dehydrogenase/reductase n=1 Tax=Niastella yeongjuensis TaxID=354355 RepID=A0A1V9E3Z0_9BACT|nr:SDR family NAD(P)-dependent oxidoreductase [Niastella yeongjuensis]OQP40781.1 short-chain dehydrogenase/reductase [Niastella yeongjuensis]SEP01892.1 Short-chain dehydrogenase [Niastella yeongjuensis]